MRNYHTFGETIPTSNYWGISPITARDQIGSPGDDQFNAVKNGTAFGFKGYDVYNFNDLRMDDLTFKKRDDGGYDIFTDKYGHITVHDVEGVWTNKDRKFLEAKDFVVDVPTWEMPPEILKGTRGDDQFPGKPGDQTYVGKGGTGDQINYTGSHSIFDGLTITEFPDGSIELDSPHYGIDHLYGIEYIWDHVAFQLMRTADLLTPPNMVYGTSGSDILFATDEIDQVFGGAGNDFLVANIGNSTNDVLDGEGGVDTAVFVVDDINDLSGFNFDGKDNLTNQVSVHVPANQYNNDAYTYLLENVEKGMFLELGNFQDHDNYHIVGVVFTDMDVLIA